MPKTQGISGFAVAIVAAGGLLAWSGVKGWHVSQVTRDLLSGKDPRMDGTLNQNALSVSAGGLVSDLFSSFNPFGGIAGALGISTTGTTSKISAPSGAGIKGNAQSIASQLLSGFGWDSSQMLPLISLWNQESGWNGSARNPSSGAFGIAQALGHGCPQCAAPDGTNEYGAQYGLTVAEAQQANAGNLLQQIRWGLGYIRATYGSPAGAWAHEKAFNWY